MCVGKSLQCAVVSVSIFLGFHWICLLIFFFYLFVVNFCYFHIPNMGICSLLLFMCLAFFLDLFCTILCATPQYIYTVNIYQVTFIGAPTTLEFYHMNPFLYIYIFLMRNVFFVCVYNSSVWIFFFHYFYMHFFFGVHYSTFFIQLVSNVCALF